MTTHSRDRLSEGWMIRPFPQQEGPETTGPGQEVDRHIARPHGEPAMPARRC